MGSRYGETTLEAPKEANHLEPLAWIKLLETSQSPARVYHSAACQGDK